VVVVVAPARLVVDVLLVPVAQIAGPLSLSTQNHPAFLPRQIVLLSKEVATAPCSERILHVGRRSTGPPLPG
jgi:hypothetical protein